MDAYEALMLLLAMSIAGGVLKVWRARDPPKPGRNLDAGGGARLCQHGRGRDMTGAFCPTNLLTSADVPMVVRLSQSFDEEGFERGERINGYECCPKCGLWWPCIEEPDCWEEDGDQWKATGWWGAVVCEECSLLMIEQPDGTPECYQL